MKRIGVYAGSFDPITNGHAWVVEQAALMFDEVIVAVGHNPTKKYYYPCEDRLQMVFDYTQTLQDNPQFSGKVTHGLLSNHQYLVHYAQEVGAKYLIRGIRNPSDFEYEHALRHINADLAPDITTVFLMPPRTLSEVSSSMVKALVGPDGWESIVQTMVPNNVFQSLKDRS